MIVFRYLETPIEIFKRLAKKEKKLIVVILRIRVTSGVCGIFTASRKS